MHVNEQHSSLLTDIHYNIITLITLRSSGTLIITNKMIIYLPTPLSNILITHQQLVTMKHHVGYIGNAAHLERRR